MSLGHGGRARRGNMGSEEQREMLFWTKEEYLKFADAMMDKPLSYYAFEMLYWCGIREGELLALTPSDFDFAAAGALPPRVTPFSGMSLQAVRADIARAAARSSAIFFRFMGSAPFHDYWLAYCSTITQTAILLQDSRLL